MPDDDSALTIDPRLRARLDSLAERSGTSVQNLIEAVLAAHADEQEREIDELVEDEARWQRYLTSGRSVPLQQVRDKLVDLAREAGGKAERR